MKYRRLGKSDLKVSVIGVGTWQLGGEWGKDYTQAEADAMFRRAEDVGINLVDTAECYGDHVSESLVGNAIASSRDKWIIATKFGHHFTGWQQRDTVYDPADVVRQLERSLRALRTDVIDLYQFHSGADAEFDTPGLWDTLRKQQEMGKVRHLGISISAKGDRLRQTQRATEVGASVIQLVYNRLERAKEADVLPSCVAQDLGVLARVPLASGFLSGKYQPGEAFPAGDVRTTHDRQKVDDMLREAQRVQREEVPPGVPMARWALAWCLQHPGVTSVIPGCRDAGQVEANAAAAELDIVADDHAQAWQKGSSRESGG